MPKEEYGAKDLAVLEGLDAVRKRPGMYIGTTDSQGLMHCLWEIIDNSVDEALAGFCNDIVVTLHTDGSVEVADNGRGIPVDKEPKTGLSGVEVVLTKLHAGAKFGNSSYNAVGGLHGVGSSVVNALSSRLDVEVDRDGKTHHMTFHQGHPGVYTDADPANPSPDSPFKRTRKNRPTELEIIGKVSPKTTGMIRRFSTKPPNSHTNSSSTACARPASWCPASKSPSSTKTYRKRRRLTPSRPLMTQQSNLRKTRHRPWMSRPTMPRARPRRTSR